MSKQDVVELEGVIIDCLPSTRFNVKLSNGHTIIAVVSGNIRKNNIRITEGDKVKLEVSPYNVELGRITYRM